MPKEVISNKTPKHSLEFRWSKQHGHAQVGVDLNQWFSFHEGDEEKDGEKNEYRSLFFTFESREDMNRAIRALRKMRDDAFGKDA